MSKDLAIVYTCYIITGKSFNFYDHFHHMQEEIRLALLCVSQNRHEKKEVQSRKGDLLTCLITNTKRSHCQSSTHVKLGDIFMC